MIEPASKKVLDIPPEVAYKGNNEHMPTSSSGDKVVLPKAVLIEMEKTIGHVNSVLAGIQRQLQRVKK